ncbi:MAG TPA: hypothetical protein V6D09_05420 [Leptolyngbyaceae cyanobacterium]
MPTHPLISISDSLVSELSNNTNPYRKVEIPILEAAYLDRFGRAFAQAPAFIYDTGHNVDRIKRDLECTLAPIAHDIGVTGSLQCYVKTVINIFEQIIMLSRVNRVHVSVRNWFAPGDLVWHVDRSMKDFAIRFIWPLGRNYGTRYTPVSNIDLDRYNAYMRRERPLLCMLDRKVLECKSSYREIWRHRPVQIADMHRCRFPFIRNPNNVVEVAPNSLVLHQFETINDLGSFHCGAAENEATPGLQTVFTATS